MGRLAADLLRSQKVAYYDDQVFVKRPNTRQRTAWHQDYPFFHATPQLVEYDEGQINFAAFGHSTHRVENVMWGRGIAIGRQDFEDMGTNPQAKSAWMQRSTSRALRGPNYLHKIIADLLLGQGNYTSPQSNDSVDLYSDSHATGSNLVDSGDGASSDYTYAQLRTEHELVLGKWADMTDPDGYDLLREETPNTLGVIVDPTKLLAYAELYNATFVPAYDGSGGGAGISNVLAQGGVPSAQGVDGLGRQVLIVGWNRFKDKDTVIYCDADPDLTGPPPILHQERVPFQMEMTEVGGDIWVKEERQLWKVRGRGNVAARNHLRLVKVDKS